MYSDESRTTTLISQNRLKTQQSYRFVATAIAENLNPKNYMKISVFFFRCFLLGRWLSNLRHLESSVLPEDRIADSKCYLNCKQHRQTVQERRLKLFKALKMSQGFILISKNYNKKHKVSMDLNIEIDNKNFCKVNINECERTSLSWHCKCTGQNIHFQL